ncbi:hypothetical protein EUX98_g9420 [Antrodiella citrinella]|uniref:Uncharacterized protein n=1 Tax=Antrodiella citrinella TaxID=2447956 RepID=A0A4S4LTG5_9APHY|nr:hypothetical protein EUX98_g9420 [Antrodiella citrinella]
MKVTDHMAACRGSGGSQDLDATDTSAVAAATPAASLEPLSAPTTTTPACSDVAISHLHCDAPDLPAHIHSDSADAQLVNYLALQEQYLQIISSVDPTPDMAVIAAASSEPQPPPNLTAESLLRAKGSELGQWIDLANKAAQEKAGNKKKVLIKTGKVESQRSRLADYYGFVLTAASGTDTAGVVVAGGGSQSQSAGTQVGGTSSTTSIASTNREIRIRQWVYMRTLCDRWREAERMCQELILIKNPMPGHFNTLAHHPVPAARVAAQVPHAIQLEPTGPPIQALAGEPLQAALQEAAVRGGVQTLQMLATLFPTAFPISSTSTSRLTHTPVPAPTSDLLLRTSDNLSLFASSQPGGLTTSSHHYEPTFGSPTRPSITPTRDCDRALTMFHLPTQPSTEPPTHPAPRQPVGLIPTSVGFGAPGGQTDTATPKANDQGRRATLSVLDSCQPEAVIHSLRKASGLRDVIKQMKNGEVQAYRARYGPSSQGEGGSVTRAHKDWNTLNVTITRRERIYREFLSEFQGNEERFFAFFTCVSDDDGPDPTGSVRKRKRKAPDDVEQLRPLRLVAEAIPHMNRDVEVEKAHSLYRDPTTADFLPDVWAKQWEGRNKWEIWRELGKEAYGKGTRATE